jgi:hypothetical protein
MFARTLFSYRGTHVLVVAVAVVSALLAGGFFDGPG